MKTTFEVKFQGQAYPCEYIIEGARALYTLDALSRRREEVRFGIDTETRAKEEFKHNTEAALSPHLGELALVQISDGERIWVFDMTKLPKSFGSTHLKPFLEAGHFVAHYALFDLSFFMHELGVTDMDIGCTQIATRLFYHAVSPTDEGLSAKLDDVAEAMFKEKVTKTLQASDWGAELTFEQLEYAALDAIVVYKIAEKMGRQIQKYGLERIYKLTKAAQFPIASMQLNGIKLNTAKHKILLQQWRSELVEARNELAKLTGLESFTGHSIARWLEENLTPEDLELWPRTETGKLATDSHVFADFSYLEIVKPFSKFQKVTKLTGTYGKSLAELINECTGRLHARYNLCGARTGRLSCSKPNLQQAPRDTEFRSLFIAADGKRLIRADFNQIEIRVAAELSRDEQMLRAYREGIDIHALTASQVANKKITEVSKEDRQMAKAVNFGFMFGLGAKKFAHYAKKSYGVEVTQDQAHDAVDAFRNTYSGYREWQIHQSTEAAQTMTVRTPCGKLRKLNTDNCYGASMNTPVQGGAAECMLYALVYLYHALLAVPELQAKIVNCVHDEIIVECDEAKVELTKQIVENSMIEGFLSVFPEGITRGLVAVEHGKNWAEAK